MESATRGEVARDAVSVNEFCVAHGISRPTLYRLWRDGQGPAHFKVGTRTLISRESAARWRAAMEARQMDGAGVAA